MELIYSNDYGASYKMVNAPNPNCQLQLIIDTVGIFMSEKDIEGLLNIVRKSNTPCDCVECGGERCNKIWTTTPLIDTCLKVDDEILELLEDLIVGTQFMLNMDTTLEKFRIK